MTEVTLKIDDEVLNRARIRALERGTSVNAVVRDYLASYAGQDPRSAACDRLVAAAEASEASSGTGGRAWTRDELHDRADLR